MCVYTYTYRQLILHNWIACSADSARLILELEVQNRQAGKEDGQKMGETKNGHPRTCPRRVSNTLFYVEPSFRISGMLILIITAI